MSGPPFPQPRCHRDHLAPKVLQILLGAIATQPVLDVILAAGLTWAAHSSVAVVFVVMSFAAKGTVPPEAAFALVLGANLGTAINPVLEGATGDNPAAKRCLSEIS